MSFFATAFEPTAFDDASFGGGGVAVFLAGVDRTYLIDAPSDIVPSDVRSGINPDVSFSIQAWWGWVPPPNTSVVVVYDTEVWFVGQLTSTTLARHGEGPLLWYYDCTATGISFILDKVQVIGERYQSTAADAIAADLMSRFAPSGFTATAIEAGLGTINDINFTGSLLECLDQLASAAGAIRYFDENLDLHFYVTTDPGAVAPDVVTEINARDIRITWDSSQVVTRQLVEGQGCALSGCAFTGDTSLLIADSSIFQSPSGQCHPDGSPVLAYTSKVNDYTTRSFSAARSMPAGTPVLFSSTSIAGLPDKGWIVLGGVGVRYERKSAWSDTFLSRGVYEIKAIVNDIYDPVFHYRYVVETTEPAYYNVQINGISIADTNEASFNVTMGNVGWIDSTHWYFWSNSAGLDQGQRGYCWAGAGTDVGINGLTASGGIASATCSAGYAHYFAVGDWIVISGCTPAEFNGTWRILTAADNGHFTFAFPGNKILTLSVAGSASFAGALPFALPTGGNYYLGDQLIGIASTPAIAAGANVGLIAQCDDLPAQLALTHIDGSDGVRTGPLMVNTDLSYAAAVVAGNAELAVRSRRERRLNGVSLDSKLRAGQTISVKVAPQGTLLIDEILADSPRGFWLLDEESGTVAADSSGLSHPGTITNAPVLGLTGLLQDGSLSMFIDSASTQYVVMASHADFDLGDVWTLECCIRRSLLGTAQALISRGDGTYLIYLAADNYLYATRANTANLARSSIKIEDTLPHHVAATKNGATTKVYIDGVDVTVPIGNSACVDTALQLRLGIYEGLTSKYKGEMAHAAVYSTALSAARIAAHAAAFRRIGIRIASMKVTSVKFQNAALGPLAVIFREFEASDRRFQPVDILRQWQTTAGLNR